MGPKLKETCKSGHILAETRRYKSAGKRGGRHPYCSTCAADRIKRARRDDPTRFAGYNRKSHLKLAYGVDPSFVDGKACGICGSPPPAEGRSHHVDHDHATGKVRGVLCSKCNTGLGLLSSEKNLLRAIEYLRSSNGTS